MSAAVVPWARSLPAFLPGIVSVNPVVLQCQRCWSTERQPEGMRTSAFLRASGIGFHGSAYPDGSEPIRSAERVG